ncbi:hypothetical protein LVB87_08715 [Lysobacter sp. KIS68-7]|uniref:hypothetical protein n=1 Tax=Lysobacter sp. KIS68-7 TaxID=2904252 RepID=UPI001E439258|nr:hypothetical protein [Lysobacter sp. KIS68-7]UHQ18308.1 hypothetical protein LVB87_08715 [Lysobacter sp. KIS68-7]
MDKNLQGQVVRAGDDDYYFSMCTQDSPRRVTCRVVTGQSKLQERGYLIHLDTDSGGAFQKSHVSRFTGWL